NDESLSRRHFLILRQGQSYFLQDLDSQNGTWVDGQRARTVKLRHYDCIAAGRTLFLFSERSLSIPRAERGIGDEVNKGLNRSLSQTPTPDHLQNPSPSPSRRLL